MASRLRERQYSSFKFIDDASTLTEDMKRLEFKHLASTVKYVCHKECNKMASGMPE